MTSILPPPQKKASAKILNRFPKLKIKNLEEKDAENPKCHTIQYTSEGVSVRIPQIFLKAGDADKKRGGTELDYICASAINLRRMWGTLRQKH